MNLFCDNKNDISMLSAIFSDSYILSINQTSKTSMCILVDRKCKEIDGKRCKIRQLCEININNVENAKDYFNSGIIAYISCDENEDGTFQLKIKFDSYECEYNKICRNKIYIHVSLISINISSIDETRHSYEVYSR